MPEDDSAGISDDRDDIYSIGRSPLWDGDPLWDRQLFYDNPDNNNAPPDIVGTFKSLGLVPLVTEPEPVDTVHCSYCGVELPFVLPEDGEAHRCFGVALPGTIAKLEDGTYVQVLEADADHVVYSEVLRVTTISLEKFLKDTK